MPPTSLAPLPKVSLQSVGQKSRRSQSAWMPKLPKPKKNFGSWIRQVDSLGPR